MKKNFLINSVVFLLIATISIAQNPIPNYSFENWTGSDPDGWQTDNAIGAFITKVSPGNTGSFAARGDVQAIMGSNIPPILSSQGNGFPVTQGYSTLYFFYKFNQVGTSEILVTANFFNNDSSSAGAGVAAITTAATNFTLGSASLFITGSPVRCIIYATLVDQVTGSPAPGNYFVLDDFSFDNIIGVPSVANTNFFMDAPVPNPSSTFSSVHFSIPKPLDVDLKIYDVFGRQLKMIHAVNTIAGENLLTLDVHDLSSGTYVLVLSSEVGMLQRRLVVSR